MISAGFDLLDDRRKVSLCAVVAVASSARLRFTDWLLKGEELSDATGYDLRLRLGEAVAKCWTSELGGAEGAMSCREASCCTDIPDRNASLIGI